jgi:peptidoglycan/LPS O-acetylase OafA/YrhL
MSTSTTYHAEIDGLRAVAVLAVVACHSHSKLCPGGFVGVDVFFVISGYLIVGIIRRELAQGAFSIADFLDRRVRRIVPAFAVMTAVVLAVAWWLSLPEDYAMVGTVAAAAALSISNVVLHAQVDYFAGDAALQPLLHTWSLSVEEQFYLVVAPTLLLLHRWLRPASLWTMLALAALGSLIWMIATQRSSPETAFYLAHLRAWELLIGAFAGGLAASPPRGRRVRETLAWAGLTAIAGSFALLDDNAPARWPWAMPACLGTAAVIVSTAGGGPPLSAARLLLWGPMRWTGRISYSLYLWHWPLLAFAAYACVGHRPGWVSAACVLASFPIAWLSWRWIEEPVRLSRKWLPTRAALCAGLGVLASVAIAGWIVKRNHGMPERIDPEILVIAAGASSFDPRRTEFTAASNRWIAPADMRIFGAPVAPSVAVWGDSHAGALAPGLATLAGSRGQALRLFAYAGALPLLGVDILQDDVVTSARKWNDQCLTAILGDPGLRTVVLVARWSEVGGSRKWLADASPDAIAGASQMDIIATGLRRTVDALKSGGRRVLISLPLPEMPVAVPRTAALLAMAGRDPGSIRLSVVDYDRRHGEFIRIIGDLTGTGVVVLDPAAWLRRGDAYLALHEGRCLYYDDDHLSLEGAALVAPAFATAFTAVTEP